MDRQCGTFFEQPDPEVIELHPGDMARKGGRRDAIRALFTD